MARTIIEAPGEDFGIGPGEFDVYGTTSGGEELTVDPGSDVWLDPSYNSGGDTIYLPGEAEEYTARVDGSYVILTSVINDVTIEIPVGPAGITIVFGGDDSRTLNYDTVDGRVEMDGVPIGGTAAPLPPGTDTPPITYTVLADSPTVTEGDVGTRLLTYTITLDQPAAEDVTITYTTLPTGTAAINDDYQPVTGTVTIPAGSTTAFVSVPVYGDTLVEGDETVQLQLTSPDMVAPQTLTGTIIDDDATQTMFNLNPGSETIIGTPAPDTFRASNNELGAGDYIDGRESVDTLILAIDPDAVDFFALFGGDLADGDLDYRGFETDNLERFLVTNDSIYLVQVDMSGTDENVQQVGTVNSSGPVQFDALNSLADALVQDLTFVPGAGLGVFYDANLLTGAADAVTLTVDSSNVDYVTLGSLDSTGTYTNTGIETVDLDVIGDSTINTLNTQLTNLDIDGTGDLVITNPLDDNVRNIDATGLVGDVTLLFTNNTVGAVYNGSSGVDTVVGGTGNDTMSGNAGNDILVSGDGADTVNGGDGNDTLDAGTGDDTVTGGAGDDTIDAGTGNDDVDTGTGNDYVWIRSGSDTVVDGGGNDTVNAEGNLDSTDVLTFGEEAGDADRLIINGSVTDTAFTNVTGLEILEMQGTITAVLAAQAQESGVERIEGDSGSQTIDASAFTRGLVVAPGTGSDNITTGSGDDTFEFVGDGALDDSDTIVAGTGLDTINSTGSIHLDGTGFSGIDVINVFSNSVGDSVVFHNLGAANADENGTLVINAGALGADDSLSLWPTFWGVSPAYQLDVIGGAGGDYIETGTADDTIRAGAGNDTVLGLAGNDDIHLGAGDDYADGDVGADRFYGDTGADVMDLGVDADVDTVLYANLSDSSFSGGDTRDTINEFDSGEDQIDIGELLARNGIDPGNTEFITGQTLDQAEAQMVADDGIYSIVFIEEVPGDPADVAVVNTTGYFFVDLNDDGELGGEDLQLFVNGEDVAEGDVDITPDNLAGDSGYDVFISDIGMGAGAKYASADFGMDMTPKFEDASFA